MKKQSFTRFFFLLALTFLGLSGMEVQGQVEQFTFTGALNANGWTTHSGTAAQINTSATGLSYTGLQASSGNKAQILSTYSEDVNKQAFSPAVNSGSTYASVLINVSDVSKFNLNSVIELILCTFLKTKELLLLLLIMQQDYT
jgi:hypothetical protein